jgi:hypothetical protein
MGTNTPSLSLGALVRASLGAAAIGAGLLAAATTTYAADACTLLTTEEIAQIVGERVRKPRPDTAQEGTACRFPMVTDTLSIFGVADGCEELRRVS